MIDRTTVAEIVTRLYTAAGRRFGDPEFVLYAEALAGVDAAMAVEASRRVVAKVDLGARPPTPRLLLEWVGVLKAEERARRLAIPSATGPLTAPDVAREEIAAARRQLAKEPSS